MPLIVVTPATDEPLTLAEAKAQLRITHAHEDELVSAAICAAREWVEQRTWRQLLNATLQLRMDQFPTVREIVLPRPRLVSVSSIQYRSGGSWATLGSSRYEVDTASEPGRIRIDEAGWPATDDALGAVKVEFVAGYGTSAANVPNSLRQAMKLLVTAFVNFRGEIPDGSLVAAEHLIDGYCVRSLREVPYLIGTNSALVAEGLA